MSKFFNAVHAPLGAHASFTLGCKGKTGGLGLERSTPASENMFIGVESRDAGKFFALPFFEEIIDESIRYEDKESADSSDNNFLTQFKDEEINREFNAGTDIWQSGDLTCSIFSAPIVAPNPDNSSEAEQMLAYCPAVVMEIKVDNRNCDNERTAFIGYESINFTDSIHFCYDLPQGISGIATGGSIGIFTDSPNALSCQGFNAEAILQQTISQNHNFGLGNTALLLLKAKANEVSVFRIALCFFRGGIVTSGEECSYWYYRYFKSLKQVAKFALDNYDYYVENSFAINSEFEAKHLNDAQKFQLYHAMRSYFVSTQLLDWDNRPFWVVNEGEYRMMNTFDLTVDQLFFELRQNPWTVKNELNMFVDRYSYTDQLFFPNEYDKLYEGGVTFTHDMGRYNHISRPHYSTYELSGLDGCFSHMSHEQLVNWILCASAYIKDTNDTHWLEEKMDVFKKTFSSMLNRDNPDPAKRNGIMGLDSSRTAPQGAEITTYDSLDTSLGQARNNVYIAVKCWAAYLALAELLPNDLRKAALEQAGRTATTICSFLNNDGFIPAIMGEECDSKIIPAIEGLVFPYIMKMDYALDENGEYGPLILALKKHLKTILKKGVCLYDDNGWKLSSSADNSWLSKIYLCQFIARQILGMVTPETTELADVAHQNWLFKPENLFYAWSDQMKSGVAIGSKYYPRGVTSILWLRENNNESKE